MRFGKWREGWGRIEGRNGLRLRRVEDEWKDGIVGEVVGRNGGRLDKWVSGGGLRKCWGR